MVSQLISDVHIESMTIGIMEVAEDDFFCLDIGDTIPLYLVLEGEINFSVDKGNSTLLDPGSLIALTKPLHHTIKGKKNSSIKHTTPTFGAIDKDKSYSIGSSEPSNAILLFTKAHKSINPVPDLIPSVIALNSREVFSNNALWSVLQLLLDKSIRSIDIENILTKRLLETIAELLLMLSFQEENKIGNQENSKSLVITRDQRIRKTIAQIHNNPFDDWSLGRLSDIANLSKSGFTERFKNLTGDTPLQYLSDIRLNKSAILLKNSSLSVLEIALKVGYKSEPSFNKAFTKKMGISPGRYRRKAREE